MLVGFGKCLRLLLLALTCSACSAGNYAPVVEAYGGDSHAKPVTRGVHVVRAGETLYSIAWRYGWDFKALARANNISSPYTIHPGQQIRLDGPIRAPVASSASSSTSRPAVKPAPKPATSSTSSKPASASSSKPVAAPVSKGSTGPVAWQWPVTGPLLSSFDDRQVGRQGIAIGGSQGDRVNAAGDGVVVYRGNGLTGYGNLLIIKHNETWLTAYAHNHAMLVKEGDKVKAGQQVATMGASGTFRNQLYFEIRKNGTPVNPVPLLPKR